MLITNDFDAQNNLQQELIGNEKFIWTGKPKTGILFRTSDIFFIPFSIIWCSFALFWESSVILSGAPFFFMIWGIPFVCAGIYITIGRFFFDKKNRDNTFYGITSNRIIIKSGVFKTTIDSYNIKTLSNISIDDKADGTGTIKLDADKQPFSGFAIAGWPGYKKAPALEFIQGVREVYNLILKQQHSS